MWRSLLLPHVTGMQGLDPDLRCGKQQKRGISSACIHTKTDPGKGIPMADTIGWGLLAKTLRSR